MIGCQGINVDLIFPPIKDIPTLLPCSWGAEKGGVTFHPGLGSVCHVMVTCGGGGPLFMHLFPHL